MITESIYTERGIKTKLEKKKRDQCSCIKLNGISHYMYYQIDLHLAEWNFPLHVLSNGPAISVVRVVG